MPYFMREAFTLRNGDAETLRGWLRQRNLAQGWALRARIVLASAEGDSVRMIAERLGSTPVTVNRWRQRYKADGLDGLRGRHTRAGRRNGLSPAKERQIVTATMTPPAGETHWSAARLAEKVRVSASSVLRVWRKHKLQPHRMGKFKLSKDPEFDAKMADVVGLYLDPPERALVLCVDEKSQIQALNRTQPMLPLRPGLPARATHDYKRNGTTSLFAALDVARGKVHGRCFSKHTHVEFVAFLDDLAAAHPRREVHLICDNYGTHKHPAVLEWRKAHQNFHFHFTPTSASWLNLVERWFAVITDRAIRRGSFDSVRELERAISKFIAKWNQDAKPFRWTKSADDIKASINRVVDNSDASH